MPQYLVFYNVGNRDVTVSPESNFRESTRQILENIQIFLLGGKTPLLEGLFRYIEGDLFEKEPEQIDPSSWKDVYLILFATDQTDASHRDKDTLHAVEILRHVVRQRHPEVVVDIKTLHENPASYDVMYETFRKLLEGYKSHMTGNGTSSGAQVIAAVSAGTPQMNMGLLLNCIELFYPRLHIIYLFYGESCFRELEIPNLLKKSELECFYKNLLDRDLYEAAGDLADHFSLGDPVSITRNRVNAARLHFDYPRVQDLLQKLLENPAVKSNDRKQIRKDIDKYTPLAKAQSVNPDDRAAWNKEAASLTPHYFQVQVEFLEELLFSIDIKLRQHLYTDFLGRIFRLLEGSLRLLVEVLWRVSTDVERDSKKYYSWEEPGNGTDRPSVRYTSRFPAFTRKALSLPQLCQFLRDRDRYPPADTNRTALALVVSFLLADLPPVVGKDTPLPADFWGARGVPPTISLNARDVDACRTFFHSYDLLAALGDLRNQSVLGHGFRRITLEEISETVKQRAAEIKETLAKASREGKAPAFLDNGWAPLLDSLAQGPIESTLETWSHTLVQTVKGFVMKYGRASPPPRGRA